MENLPPRPIMGAVILPAPVYDDAKALGADMAGYIRGSAIPTRRQKRQADREGAAAREKLGKWAQRGGRVMGISDVRAAFNLAGEPAYSCQRCTMVYRPAGGRQFRVLTFSGIGPDGRRFEVKTDPLDMAADLNQAAADAARKLMGLK